MKTNSGLAMTDDTRRSRGRPPKGEFADKSCQLATRVTPELRAAIDVEAARNGRSVSQEVERRLRDSFDAGLVGDKRGKLADLVGGPQNLALFRTLHWLARNVELHTRERWIDDPFTFEQVRKAFDFFLEAIKPPGDPQPTDKLIWPAPLPAEFVEYLSVMIARGVLDCIALAADEPAISKDGTYFSENYTAAPAIKTGLGDLAIRLKDPKP